MRATSFLSVLFSLSATLCAAEEDTWPWQTYKSSSLEPPNLKITKNGPTSPGHLFFDQSWSAHQYGAFIMSEDNELIWQSGRGDLKAFKPQILDGEPVLTFFNGLGVPEPFGWGYGIIQVLDSSYESIYNVSVENDNYKALGSIDSSSFVSWIDMHEDTITPEGTMLVTGYNVTQADLSSMGGPVDGWIADSLFYEIDVKTNEILFRWSAADHTDEIPMQDVEEFYPLEHWGRNDTHPWGYFHINSVEKFNDGSYLISSRYYCSLFRIVKDGSVDWTLQGKSGGDFELNGVNFCFQHDARIHGEKDNKVRISIFDNANSDVQNGTATEGILMDVDVEKYEVSLVRTYDDPTDEIYATSQGNTQVLPSGGVLMGYGSIPKLKEYSANGTCVLTAQFGPDNVVASYRGYKSPWIGRPTTAPDAFACVDRAHNSTNVYMSWNGATEHKVWKVYGGSSESLRPVAQVAKTGFETLARVHAALDWVRVEAIGNGTHTGVSEVVAVEGQC